jgi:hypothetical protein
LDVIAFEDGVNIPEVIGGLILNGMIAWTTKRAHWRRAKEQRARAWESAVETRLAQLRKGRFPRADDTAAAGVPLEEDETVYGIVGCERCVPKTVTRHVLRYREGDLDVDRVTKVAMENKGLGTLVITDKRVVFNKPGKGRTWTREWRSLIGWDVGENQIIIEPAKGNTQVFDTWVSRCLGARFVDGDVRCAAFILQKVHPQ